MKASKKKFSTTPLTDSLKKEYALVDTELETAIKQLKLFAKGHLYGLTKKRGVPVVNVMFSILIWPLLSIRSLNFFCGNRLAAYFNGKKDVLYDFLKRQNINWRGYRLHVAKQTYNFHHLNEEKIQAAAFDDSIVKRRGKGVGGVSSHYDHTTGNRVMGQQVLEMGLVTPKAYLPLDSQIYVGDKKVQNGKLEDHRSTVGHDLAEAMNSDKNQMLRKMLTRAKRSGFRLTHVIADAWFGNRKNIKAIIKADLIGILRMKRSNLQYIYRGSFYTLTQLHTMLQRKMNRVKGTNYKAYVVNVSLELSENKKKSERIQVRLLFSAPVNSDNDNWVVFLSTDPRLSTGQILSIYSLRWGIEVYFKEVKQHFGLLKEQTGDYAVHYASIHLAAIRFIIIMHIMLNTGDRFGTVRNRLTKRLETITFARILWELFRALIFGTLDNMQDILSADIIELIKTRIDSDVSDFLDKALQLDEFHIERELKAQKCGEL